MSGSVSKIEKMIKEAEEEIETIKKKRVRLLEENEEEMQSAQRRMNESINLKEYLLAWGAEDEKVTNEWSSSE
jgi:cellobiose-specific phosphotransferase system component IIA